MTTLEEAARALDALRLNPNDRAKRQMAGQVAAKIRAELKAAEKAKAEAAEKKKSGGK